ncbi:hypothetical protein HOC_10149 [Hyphomonas oceanitis SCH89]|uniref:Lipoprotein n=1 Tax=Hyphomonas oceanitis SCH89 TaxID=1280953 RepID=A0A059G768_9PROT|nr:hypothetical protein HOC_10149 [Hyphomonas oceanitis SCH89]
MKWLAFLVVLAISGCGVSYVAPTAKLGVEFQSVSDLDTASVEIQHELNRLGFETQPATEGWTSDMLDSLSSEFRLRMSHTISFWRHQSEPVESDVHGEIIAVPTSSDADSWPVDGVQIPYIEINITDFRAGGFSPQALQVYDDTLAVLRQHGYQVIVISPPPPTDEKENGRVKIINMLAAAGWWTAVWAISMAIFGGLAMWGLRRINVDQNLRRLTLVCIGVIVVTPFQASTMFVSIFLPNVFFMAFGYSHEGEPWQFDGNVFGHPFLASFVLSAVGAVVRVRDNVPDVTSK